MALLRRNKSKRRAKKPSEAGPEPANSKPERDHSVETSPQRVGIVSGVLSHPADFDGPSRFDSVVERRFGPDCEGKDPIADDDGNGSSREAFVENEEPGSNESLVDKDAESPKLEVDPMAHIGHATTITGDVVAEEDLEIDGTIEGSVRLPNHRVTIGSDGIVKASVEAHTVLVIGKITGDVTATELVEIKAGGVIGGDVKAPRVIMNDGAIVVGGLDMSAALATAGAASISESSTPERPGLMRVERPDESPAEEESV